MLSICLTHFSSVSHFYTPLKRQKTFGFHFIQPLGFKTFGDTGLKWVKTTELDCESYLQKMQEDSDNKATSQPQLDQKLQAH